MPSATHTHTGEEAKLALMLTGPSSPALSMTGQRWPVLSYWRILLVDKNGGLLCFAYLGSHAPSPPYPDSTRGCSSRAKKTDGCVRFGDAGWSYDAVETDLTPCSACRHDPSQPTSISPTPRLTLGKDVCSAGEDGNVTAKQTAWSTLEFSTRGVPWDTFVLRGPRRFPVIPLTYMT